MTTDRQKKRSGPMMWTNALRMAADRYGVDHNDVAAVIAWASDQSDDTLLVVRNFGPKGLAWLRSQDVTGHYDRPLRPDDL